MGRDAPADLDALLTSREREVLELLRPGLTNGQIADRLDISVAGVRYHVSEIIGKLGVRNRYEAAAWPARPPWWLAAAAPLALFWRQAKALAPLKLSSAALAVSGGLLVASLAGIGLILFLLLRDGDDGIGLEATACPSNAPPAATDDGGELTLEELTDRVAEALTCPGYVLHLRSAGDFEAGPYSAYLELDFWLDLERNQGRIESRSRFNSEAARQAAEEEGEELPELREVTIVRNDGHYTGESGPEVPATKQRPPTCLGPEQLALSLLLLCGEITDLDDLEIGVEQDVSYQGRSAFAFVATGTRSTSDETYETTSRVYLNRDTFLPLGLAIQGTLDTGDVYLVDYDVAYQAQFVPLDSLPPDFFDPASIGYVEVDPEERLETQNLGVTAYWLGREFEGGDGLPALALQSVTIAGDMDLAERPISPSVRIFYRAADDEFGLGMVVLEIYKPESWEAFFAQSLGSNWWQGPCVQREEVDLPDASAIIYAGPGGSDGLEVIELRPPLEEGETPPPVDNEDCPPPGLYIAHVDPGNTFVAISAPGVYSGSTYTESPYNSQMAMELLVRSLTPRQ
jgi:DNA-binding CsgD family transcriptional regulator